MIRMGRKVSGFPSFWVLLAVLVVMTGLWIFEQIYFTKQIENLKTEISNLQIQNNSLSENETALNNEIKRLLDQTAEPAVVTPKPATGQLIKEGFINIAQFDPNIRVELRYATTDNFTGQVLYDYKTCILKIDTAVKLLKVSEQVQKDGYFIKIWDGYREPQASWKLWNAFPDPNFVSNPDNGDTHCRGTTVDLTIVDGNGNELAMPTAYDVFTADASGAQSTGEALKNWQYLKRVMEQFGFTSYSGEWWHYNDSNFNNFIVTDVDVKALFE